MCKLHNALKDIETSFPYLKKNLIFHLKNTINSIKYSANKNKNHVFISLQAWNNSYTIHTFLIVWTSWNL